MNVRIAVECIWYVPLMCPHTHNKWTSSAAVWLMQKKIIHFCVRWYDSRISNAWGWWQTGRVVDIRIEFQMVRSKSTESVWVRMKIEFVRRHEESIVRPDNCFLINEITFELIPILFLFAEGFFFVCLVPLPRNYVFRQGFCDALGSLALFLSLFLSPWIYDKPVFVEYQRG